MTLLLDEDFLPSRFLPMSNHKQLAPCVERRTPLARLQPVGRQRVRASSANSLTSTSNNLSEAEKTKALQLQNRISAQLWQFNEAQVVNALTRVDSDRDGKVTLVQLRDALGRLLVDFPEEELRIWWTARCDPRQRGTASVALITKQLTGSQGSSDASSTQGSSKDVKGGTRRRKRSQSCHERDGKSALLPPPRPTTAKSKLATTGLLGCTTAELLLGGELQNARKMGRTGKLSCTGLLNATKTSLCKTKASLGSMDTSTRQGMQLLVTHLRKSLSSLRPQVMQRLQRLDKAQNGLLPCSRFFEVLEHFKCMLTRQQHHGLVEWYGDASGCNIRYHDLAMQVFALPAASICPKAA